MRNCLKGATNTILLQKWKQARPGQACSRPVSHRTPLQHASAPIHPSPSEVSRSPTKKHRSLADKEASMCACPAAATHTWTPSTTNQQLRFPRVQNPCSMHAFPQPYITTCQSATCQSVTCDGNALTPPEVLTLLHHEWWYLCCRSDFSSRPLPLPAGMCQDRHDVHSAPHGIIMPTSLLPSSSS